MMRHLLCGVAVPFLLQLACADPGAPVQNPTQSEEGWRALFNGKDLTGWDTWLPAAEEGLGLNKDPKGVYKVVEADGAPAIRISGEIFGGLSTKEEFENYHFRLEVKWGTKKWPPREDTIRDSGLLYHCYGPHGAAFGVWMKSLEYQIQEGDFGDYFAVAGPIVDVEGECAGDPNDGTIVYKKGAKKSTVGTGSEEVYRITKSLTNEKPLGEWNVLDLYCFGETSVHVVNGKVNMILTRIRRLVDGKEVPLTRGKLELQSEAAEVFYRKPEIRPIKEIPREVLN